MPVSAIIKSPGGVGLEVTDRLGILKSGTPIEWHTVSFFVCGSVHFTIFSCTFPILKILRSLSPSSSSSCQSPHFALSRPSYTYTYTPQHQPSKLPIPVIAPKQNMSWSSASSSSSGSASEQRQHEAALPETEAWDAHGAGRGADEGDWLGAFYVPRGEPPAPEWLAVEPPETQDRAQVGAQDKLQSCISCGTLTKDLRQLRCGHLWGGSCLLARIELALRWEGNWPARCCEKIDEGEMRRLAPFLEEGIVKRYLDKYEEMETQRDQRIYCADARCSAFLGPRGTGINWGSCGKCGISTCLKCGNAGQLHGHDQCPPETTVVSHGELIRGGKLQQCPGCPEVVELREACNHTT